MSDVKKQIETLRRLAQLDVDAIELYDAAIDRVHVQSVKDQLLSFRVDHERHVQDLNAMLVSRGEKAVERKRDLKGTLLRGFTAATSMMGTEAALIAMIGNEELTNRTYQAALKIDWDAEAKALLEKNYSDERRHLAWIKDAARHRPWAHGAEAHV